MLPRLLKRWPAPLLAAALLLPAAARAQAPAPPANDDCAGAITLPVAAQGSSCTPLTATNANATASAGVANPTCSVYQGGDVWYAVTVPASGALQVTSSAVAGSLTDDTMLALYSGPCGALTEVACNDDQGSTYFSQVVVGGRTPGEVLYLRAATYANDNPGEFGLCAQELLPCAAPTGVAVRNIRASRATVSYAPNPLASSYTITYTPAGGPTQTAATGGASLMLQDLLPGTTYSVTVASDCGATQPASAPVTFTTSPTAVNDDCAGAISLPVVTRCTSPTLIDTDVASASAGVADPACANYQGGDVWYTVTVPANGVLMLETSAVPGGSRSGLAVYSGSCNSLAELTCDETSSYDNYSYLRLSGRPAGEVLYVRAWVPGNRGGRFGLCATTDDGQPTLTWTGAVSTDWFTAGNWSPAQVPTAATNAWVPEGAPNWPVLTGGTAQVRTLTFDKYAEFQLPGGTLAVAGDLRNRADAGYVRFQQVSGGTATGGVLAFVGTTAQQAAGLGQVYHLRVATAGSTVTLRNRVRVFYRLTMAGGLLDTGPGWVELWRDTDLTDEFTFLTTARLAGESETSYVQGRILTLREVNQNVREDFSGLGMTQFTAAAATPGVVFLNRYTGPPQPDVAGRPGIARTYVVQADQETGLNLTMDVHYFAHELNGLADADLRPYSSPLDGNNPAQPAGPWTLESPSTRLAPVAVDSASTVRLTGLTHLSAWTLGAAAAPLPVQLSAFTAEASGPAALLRWATASELRSAYFAVEASPDGRTFAEVGRVTGAGSSAGTRQYQLRDAHLGRYASPVVYYRLRQVDTDGTAAYSPVRTLAVAAPAAAPSAYPNPYTQALTVQLPAPAAGPVQLVLRDVRGREVLRHTAPAGATEVPLPGAERLPAGLYLLGITAEGHTIQLRVSRQ